MMLKFYRVTPACMALLCCVFTYMPLLDAAPIPSPGIIGGSASLYGTSHDDDAGGFGSARIFDGNLSTMYASNMQGVNTYLDFDFGSSIAIGGMSQINNNIYDGITSSELIFSDDPTFSTVISTIGLAQLTNLETSANAFRFNPVTAQYARWQITGIEGGSDTQGAREILFHDGNERGRVSMTHIADSGQYSGSYSTLNAYDGIIFQEAYGTQWATNRNGDAAFMDFDLGSEQAIGGFVHSQRVNDHVVTADLIFSNDPTFTTVIATESISLNAGNYAQTSVNFNTVNARYVRFDATDVGGTTNPGAANMYFVAAGADTTVPENDLISGFDAAATSQYSDGMLIRILDGNGLSENNSLGRHMGATASTGMWHSGPLDAGIPGGTGKPPVVAEQEIIVDMGYNVDLESMYAWNMNQINNTGRGVDEFDLYVSSDGNPSTWTLVGTKNLAEASGQHGEPAQIVPVNLQDVRMVKLDIKTNHSGVAVDYVGLSELRFKLTNMPESDENLLRPVSASASTAHNTHEVELLINGIGTPLPNIDRADFMHANNEYAVGMWHAARQEDGTAPVVADQWVSFDLGDNFDLDGALIWNHNQEANTARGVDEFDIYISNDDNQETFEFLGTFNLTECDGSFASFPETVDFEADDVRLIMFDIKTAHSGLLQDYVGLSEVRFMLARLPGDANGDRSVDVTDLGILATNYGASGDFGWEDADFTGDGIVDVTDLGILATNYGTAAVSAVPEATVLAGLSILMPILLVLRRQQVLSVTI